MSPRAVRVFSAELHIGLIHNFVSLELERYELQVEDVCLSGHWPLVYPEDPTRRWWTLRQLRGHFQYAWPYSYDLFERWARGMRLVHGRYFARKVDFVYVSFPAPLFHLYRHLDVKILLQVSFRLGGLMDSPDLPRLIELLQELHAAGRLVLLASNEYDRRHVKYLTGLDCEVASVDCNYYGHLDYRPEPGLPALAGPLRLSAGGNTLLPAIRAAVGRPLPTMREAYPHDARHIHDRLRRHACIVMLPYSVHCISISECLRSNIPLLFPSHRLLSRWHADHQLISERRSALRHGRTHLPLTPSGLGTMPDPEDDLDEAAASWWLRLCDWYAWPVVLFDDVEELTDQLETTDFAAVSERMRAFNHAEKARNAEVWSAAIQRLLG